MEQSFDPKARLILYGYRGSIAHGMYIPPEEEMGTDDVDWMGVCVAPIDYYFGLRTFENMESFEGKDDIVIYDIRKFFRILMKGNPNVLSFLWNDPSMFTQVDQCGKMILDNKELFSSQAAFYAFQGYAQSQLHKMDQGVYQGYMGAKRKGIVDQFGYDTKNASHLIRLLRLGIEFITTGKLTVKRTYDRDELIAIKRGQWSREKVLETAHILFDTLEHDFRHNCVLPDRPNDNKVNDLLTRIVSVATSQYYWVSKTITVDIGGELKTPY